MGGRVLWVVPSRGRPTRLKQMLRAGLGWGAAGVSDFAVLLDDGDPGAAGYAMVADWAEEVWYGRVAWDTAPREPITGRINRAALAAAAYEAVGFLGDDHLPAPPRGAGAPWDAALLAALEAGAPLAYGDDLHQGPNLPTFVLAQAEVVRALGWLCLPALSHYFFDNVWKDLGAVYVPQVVAEHRHPIWGNAARDATYADAEPGYQADEARYEQWRDSPDFAADVAIARAAAALVPRG